MLQTNFVEMHKKYNKSRLNSSDHQITLYIIANISTDDSNIDDDNHFPANRRVTVINTTGI